jgi:hypothetical protein
MGGGLEGRVPEGRGTDGVGPDGRRPEEAGECCLLRIE